MFVYTLVLQEELLFHLFFHLAMLHIKQKTKTF